jgi:hypothetical protein
MDTAKSLESFRFTDCARNEAENGVDAKDLTG